ncbi:magnesium transporter [Pseudomonadota bacterium]
MTDQNTATVSLLHGTFFEHYPWEATQELEKIPAATAADILTRQPINTTIGIWNRLSSDISGSIISLLGDSVSVQILNQIDPVRAAALLLEFEPEHREELITQLKPSVARELRSIMSHPPESAGSIMDPRIILFRPHMSVGDVLTRLRTSGRKGVRSIYVVDNDDHLCGMVTVQDLALSTSKTQLQKLIQAVPAFVNPTTQITEVVSLQDQYRLTDLPVVDYEQRLIGVVRQQALVSAAEQEASSVLQTMVGVSKEERALSKASFSIRKRLPWLQINLATAFLAAAVVGLFEDTIAKFTALAVLLPVVAGQSGNTGAQALAVTMRGLALREIRPSHWPRVVFKEAYVGFWNGIAVALVTSIGVLVWSNSTGLAFVIGISMILSMVIASIAGAAVPILLTVFNQDPAQSSSIFLTTVTDVMGFFSFLGIATLLSDLL